MKINFQNFITVFAIFLIIGVFCVFSGVEKVESTASDNVTGYAWSDNIGWICFNSDDDPVTSKDYGVHIDNATGEFSGYAWSDSVGWISFNRAETGVPPAAPYNGAETYIAKLINTNEVSGWAKVLSTDSWIRLSDKSNGYAGDDIHIDLGNGNFHNYAWSDDYGWISFNCVTGGPGGTDVCGSTGDYKVATSFSFNEAPTINSVSHSPNVKESGIGELVNFASDAFDPDPSDKIKLYVCENSGCSNCEPGNTSGCLQGASGAVVSVVAKPTDPSAEYETGDCEFIEKNYWAKVYDLSDECSGTVAGSNPLIIRKHNGCACGCSNGPCDECYGDNGSNGCCCNNVCQVCSCGTPVARNLDFENVNYCLSGSNGYIGLKWIYDNISGVREQQFHIQVSISSSRNPDGTFVSPMIDEYASAPWLLPGSYNTSGLNVVITPLWDYDIPYNDTYYWQVEVQDQYGGWSNWASGPNIITSKYPYPGSDFTIDPQNPAIGDPIQLCTTDIAPCPTRVSVCYSAGGEIACHTAGKDFLWTIPEIPVNGSFDDPVGGPTSYNPIIQFDALVNASITLEITDNSITAGAGNCASAAVGCCAITKNVNATSLPLPEWQEISPSF